MVTVHAHNVILVHELLVYMMSTQYDTAIIQLYIIMMKKLVETNVFLRIRRPYRSHPIQEV
jgi:hypothetical protein